MAALDRMPAKTSAMENVLRLTSVLRVLPPEYRVLRRFVTGRSSDGAATRFSARLVALGPVFVKLGQILSTRPDVMPT
jgi:ubiquinone biosynthesis protein